MNRFLKYFSRDERMIDKIQVTRWIRRSQKKGIVKISDPLNGTRWSLGLNSFATRLTNRRNHAGWHLYSSLWHSHKKKEIEWAVKLGACLSWVTVMAYNVPSVASTLSFVQKNSRIICWIPFFIFHSRDLHKVLVLVLFRIEIAYFDSE